MELNRSGLIATSFLFIPLPIWSYIRYIFQFRVSDVLNKVIPVINMTLENQMLIRSKRSFFLDYRDLNINIQEIGQMLYYLKLFGRNVMKIVVIL
ncbi:hypothetical protein COK68_00690 [Priestia megaterium]|nr:hypothetical protein COK68_00690 [Priestia megaterium]